MHQLDAIRTPAYVADIAAIKRNLMRVTQLKEATGCRVILALKAFSMYSLFGIMRDALDGTTASGIYEARLGYERFGKEVHAYSPAFTDDEIIALLPICQHIYFNSIYQLERYGPIFREKWGKKAVIGLRMNPQLSLVKTNMIYDPSSRASRFGVQMEELTTEIISKIDAIHVHNLCENLADDSVALINHLSQTLGHILDQVQYVNLGGGHYINHEDYNIEKLIKATNKLQKAHNITCIFEPGGAIVYKAGYLVARVIDIIINEKPIAILDTSATCHMPDVLEVPYRPHIYGSEEVHKKPYQYIIAGKTCLTGDIIGEYSFDDPLSVGTTLLFDCMMQYTMVKNNTFNGMPLPDIGVLHEDGRYELVKSFAYHDFEYRLS